MIIYISEGVPLFPCFFLLTFLAIPEINLNILSQEIAQLEVNKKVPQAIRASAPPPPTRCNVRLKDQQSHFQQIIARIARLPEFNMIWPVVLKLEDNEILFE